MSAVFQAQQPRGPSSNVQSKKRDNAGTVSIDALCWTSFSILPLFEFVVKTEQNKVHNILKMIYTHTRYTIYSKPGYLHYKV